MLGPFAEALGIAGPPAAFICSRFSVAFAAGFFARPDVVVLAVPPTEPSGQWSVVILLYGHDKIRALFPFFARLVR